jgi:hypothetical protein
VGGCGYDIRKRQGVFCKTTGADRYLKFDPAAWEILAIRSGSDGGHGVVRCCGLGPLVYGRPIEGARDLGH